MVNWPEAVAYLQSCPPGKAKEQLLRLAMGKCRLKAAKPKIRLPRGLKAKAKKESLPKLKKELDRVFSIWIRTRGLKDSELSLAYCVTCGRTGEWQQMDAGHYVPRQDLAVRWNELNVWTQCKSCNGFRGGEPEKMAAHIDQTCGEGTAKALREAAKKPFRLNRDWLKKQIAVYKDRIGEREARGEQREPQQETQTLPVTSTLPTHTQGELTDDRHDLN